MMAQFTDYLETAAVDGMGTDREDVPVIAALSIAISLKRIADVMTGPCNAYGENFAEAIQGAIVRGQKGIA